jgi:dihydroneopterin aldolase
MNDLISLNGLRVWGRHGVLPEERRDGQDFLVDAELTVDTRPAAATDELSATVDYAALADQLVAVVAGEPVQLIETLAARLAEVCLADDRVLSAKVTVRKPSAPLPHAFSHVSVTVVRP